MIPECKMKKTFIVLLSVLAVMSVSGCGAGKKIAEKGTEEAVRRGKEGMKYGTLKGILWHQGCGDCSPENRDTYLKRLAPMVKALRRELGVGEEVPFIAGELAYWRPSSVTFNQMLHGITEAIPNSAWVSAEGCGPLKPETLNTGNPDPHFSRDGQFLLGKRYAEKLIEITSGNY